MNFTISCEGLHREGPIYQWFHPKIPRNLTGNKFSLSGSELDQGRPIRELSVRCRPAIMIAKSGAVLIDEAEAR